MSAFRDSAIARRRQDLNPLTTALTPVHHLQTPSSSTSLSTPFGYNPSAFTPISAANSYNPQQWDRGSVGSDRSLRYPVRPSTLQQEVEAPAPPPYSPPRSNQASHNVSPEEQTTPNMRSSPAAGYRPSSDMVPSSTVPLPLQTSTPSRDRVQVAMGSYGRRQTNSDMSWISPESSVHRSEQNEAIIVQSPESDPASFNSRPPASRRAVSASAISTPTSSRSRTSSTSRWEPGMPLPPPPPGPPPPSASSRSQSMTRSSDRVLSPPTRRPPHMQSTLGPVPPTPAGWVDEDAASRGRSPNPPLVIDTASAVSTSTVGESNSDSSSSALTRTGAVRGESRSIRERRSESRTGKQAVKDEVSNNPWAEAITPSDIVVPNTVLGRRPTITKSTPRSSRFGQNAATPNSGNPTSANSYSTKTATPLHTGDMQSRGSTPRPMVQSAKRVEAPTPPFSPNAQKSPVRRDSPRIPPKSLPTPPPQSFLPASAHPSPRPVSHIFHIPNSDPVVSKPLSPSRPASRPPSRPASSRQSNHTPISPQELFSRAAMDRHNAFAEKEAAAANDDERVHMFAEFIVSESRLRRDRYAAAIDNMGSELLELTRDLFRPYTASSRRESTNSRSGGVYTPESSTQRSHQGSLMAAVHDVAPLKLNTSDPVPVMEPPSPMVGRPETTWWNGYMPSLSPIPSMSVSEQLDETSSRGRPSSRWWEVSQEGSTGAPSTKLERSKRESKYMGMAKEVREALQWDNSNHASPHVGTSSQMQYGADEYPPEKVGLHEQDTNPRVSSPGFSPAQFSPNPRHLDISRLITLPPSYPRHHPAVNNNHPDLAPIRTVVRQLSNFSDIESRKDSFLTTMYDMREVNETAKAKRRSALRHNIQREIESGNMSYADAAKVEIKNKETEEEKAKQLAKSEFDLFQAEVVGPLNEILMDRITCATNIFENLRSQLFVDAQKQSPNLTQEEGDEEPELLEKLTLLKWIFEAREGLHRELYDLLTDRNSKYRDMVIQPYLLAGNEAKADNASKFFAEDAQKRQLQFEQEILKRTEEFMDIIETNVVRGVEVQLSAFWDIAPLLKDLVEQIPPDLDGFQLQIPPLEIEENPSYAVFPVQYLYSLLSHAEKSTYQFIESQINLLCLLHEVKGMVTSANCRLMRSQRVGQGEDRGEVEGDLAGIEREEERRLTEDLKGKVGCVEELWGSALGGVVGGVRRRCVGFLEGVGGWDEDGSL